MSGWSPPRPSRQQVTVVAVLYLLLLAYGLLIIQQILLVVMVGLAGFGLYFGYRLLLAIEAIADALQRMAHQRERE
jgi:hypothetical protein